MTVWFHELFALSSCHFLLLSTTTTVTASNNNNYYYNYYNIDMYLKKIWSIKQQRNLLMSMNHISAAQTF